MSPLCGGFPLSKYWFESDFACVLPTRLLTCFQDDAIVSGLVQKLARPTYPARSFVEEDPIHSRIQRLVSLVLPLDVTDQLAALPGCNVAQNFDTARPQLGDARAECSG